MCGFINLRVSWIHWHFIILVDLGSFGSALFCQTIVRNDWKSSEFALEDSERKGQVCTHSIRMGAMLFSAANAHHLKSAICHTVNLIHQPSKPTVLCAYTIWFYLYAVDAWLPTDKFNMTEKCWTGFFVKSGVRALNFTKYASGVNIRLEYSKKLTCTNNEWGEEAKNGNAGGETMCLLFPWNTFHVWNAF